MKRFGEPARDAIEALLARYPRKKAALLPVLHLAEREFGAIDEEAIRIVAELLDLPAAHVHGVSTFCSHFRRAGVGKDRVMVCSTLSCALRGSEEIFDHLCGRLGVKKGETTADGRFTVEKVECLGACDAAPVVRWNDDDLVAVTIEAIEARLDEAEGR
jgi:NADH-quinone oxidoreductase E subunit